MQIFLSLENCKKLKEWGCEVSPQCYWCKTNHGDYYEVEKYPLVADFIESGNIATYDLIEIITNGELANKFFGKDVSQCEVCPFACNTHITFNLLQQNKHKEAEEYFMENTVFNPNNK